MARLTKKAGSMGLKKKKLTTLAELHNHKQSDMALTSRAITRQKKRKSLVHGPVVKRIGMKDIVITPLSEITPIVIEASPIHKRKISPQQRKIAKILKQMPFADIRRIGIDILGE